MMTVDDFKEKYGDLKHYQTGIHWIVDDNGNVTEWYRYCKICRKKCKETYGISYQYDGVDEAGDDNYGGGRIEVCKSCYKKHLKEIVDMLQKEYCTEE